MESECGFIDSEGIDFNNFYLTGKGIVFIQNIGGEPSGIQVFMSFEDLKSVLNPNFVY